MQIYNKIPFLRPLLSLICGIFLGVNFGFKNELAFIIVSVLFSISLYLHHKTKTFQAYRFKYIYGCVMNSMIALIGFQYAVYHTNSLSSSHFSNLLSGYEMAVVKVYKQPTIKDKTIRIFGSVKQMKSKSWFKTSGNIVMIMPKDSASLKICYGDYLMIKSPIEPTTPPMNPCEFDYKKYLSFQSVYHQTYLTTSTFITLDRNQGNAIVSCAYQLQKKLLKTFNGYLSGKREIAVISALILGDTDGIDNDLFAAYANTGAIHVLSVSGMHTGLIFIALNYLLFFMQRRKWLRIIKAVFIISFLSFYALLTGLSPAVLRSVFMLSLIIIGNTMDRDPMILNTIAVSAFALLLFDPYLIMNVGFLLSYFAITGIVVLHPTFKELHTFRFALFDKLWSATCASFAAQIAVFPIVILFFHQLPVYFWLSNVFVWILTPFIMGSGIFLLLIQKISFLSVLFGKATSILVYLLNLSVIEINNIPNSIWSGISITPLEAFLIYLAFILFYKFIKTSKPKLLILCLSIMLIILSNQFYANLSTMKQKKIIIYDINKHTAIDFVAGHSSIFVADTNLLENKSLVNYHINANRAELKINTSNIITTSFDNNQNNIESIHFKRIDNFIQFYDKRIAIINSKTELKNTAFPLTIDYLILIGNPNIKIKDITKTFNIKHLIIGSSNNKFRNKKWIEECYQANIDVYSIIDSGALVINL